MEKKKAGLAALSEWKHINCLRPITKDNIQDDALRKLIDIHGPSSTTDDTFLRKSKIDTILASIDLQNIPASDKYLTTHDVPGGTVSYIFQKSTATLLAPEEQGQEEAFVEA